MPADAASSPSVSELQRRVDALAAELRARTADHEDALQREAAVAEVLQVINSSPGDLAPVFEAILEKAHSLCETTSGSLHISEGEMFRAVAVRGLAGALADRLRQPVRPGPKFPVWRLIAGERYVQIANIEQIDDLRLRDAAELGGFRTVLFVPLRKEQILLGYIVASRKEIRLFSEKQIALLENFAAQAVIAMENARLLTEQGEALDQQTATAEVLQVINSSPGNLGPVFDAMLEKATRLCGVPYGQLALFDGEHFRFVAVHGEALFERQQPRDSRPPSWGVTWPLIVAGENVVHMPDVAASEIYRSGHDSARRFVDTGGGRSLLSVALRNDRGLLGALTVYSRQLRPFSEKQVALLQNFAAQAVIAMENARLLSEQREALERQTATAEVLQVINSSPDNLRPVFEIMLEKALRLCEAAFGVFWTYDGSHFHASALLGVPHAFADFAMQSPHRVGNDNTHARALRGETVMHIVDAAASEAYRAGDPLRRALVDLGGARTSLGVALRKGDVLLGVLILYRKEVQPFTDRQVSLVEDFAVQAVIAMENARILGELRDRQAELRVTFDNMGDGVAMFDSDHRLAAWNRNFEQIMSLSAEWLVRRPSYAEYLELLAERGEFGTENVEAELASRLLDTNRELRLERTRTDGTVIEVRRNAVPGGGFVLIYSDVTEQRRAEAAIRAARDDAEAALERQTATADILKVIASSPSDVQPVLVAVVKAALRFCGATDAVVILRESNDAVVAAHEGPLIMPPGTSFPLNLETASGRAILGGQTCHFPDIRSLDRVEFAANHRIAAAQGFRAAVSAPLLRKGIAIGSVALRKAESGPFTPQQIELLETFAAQAVIAIENVRLFTELRDSLERLKSAQANLVQAEKMASLGQLTAGIAHEIKNPLNFVNNFAGLSSELLDEVKQAVDALLAEPDEDKHAELQDTMNMLTGNLAKIVEHGRRADGIVKSMLSHSRGGKGDWQESSINALVEEALNLAYHGARAQDLDFNVSIERDFTPETKPIEVVPQDATRVFLNLFGNGFYAVMRRQQSGTGSDYHPTLTVSTRDVGDAVEVMVRDNGIGIPPEVREKLFQPFFTTKPTGEGTGLGLSISYDIVTQQHGGSIEVESEPGVFTEFTVRLPRRRRVA